MAINYTIIHARARFKVSILPISVAFPILNERKILGTLSFLYAIN